LANPGSNFLNQGVFGAQSRSSTKPDFCSNIKKKVRETKYKKIMFAIQNPQIEQAIKVLSFGFQGHRIFYSWEFNVIRPWECNVISILTSRFEFYTFRIAEGL
jgi:hypothetical protein